MAEQGGAGVGGVVVAGVRVAGPRRVVKDFPPVSAVACVAQRAAGAQLLEDAVAFCDGEAFGVLQRDRGEARELDVLGVAWATCARLDVVGGASSPWRGGGSSVTSR
jgi:hypothetical protein